MKLKDKIKIKDYIDSDILSNHNGYVKFKTCPICKKKDHFIVKNNNTYYSFSGCCKGGDSIDFMKECFGMSYIDCLKEFGNDIEVNNVKPQLSEEDKKHIFNITSYIEKKVNNCIQYLESINDIESILKITEIKDYNIDDEYSKRYFYILSYFRSFTPDKENTSKVVNKEALF